MRSNVKEFTPFLVAEPERIPIHGCVRVVGWTRVGLGNCMVIILLFVSTFFDFFYESEINCEEYTQIIKAKIGRARKSVHFGIRIDDIWIVRAT